MIRNSGDFCDIFCSYVVRNRRFRVHDRIWCVDRSTKGDNVSNSTTRPIGVPREIPFRILKGVYLSVSASHVLRFMISFVTDLLCML